MVRGISLAISKTEIDSLASCPAAAIIENGFEVDAFEFAQVGVGRFHAALEVPERFREIARLVENQARAEMGPRFAAVGVFLLERVPSAWSCPNRSCAFSSKEKGRACPDIKQPTKEDRTPRQAAPHGGV